MNKLILILCFFWSAHFSWSQSFAPAAGQLGSTAIHKDSSVFVSWANTCAVARGFMQIDHPEFGFASFGAENYGAGVAEGNSIDIVSLGDAGSAMLTFNPPIKNGIGPDFAVFENGFADHYMELAFVEVSSNGVDFYRFPAYSETPLEPQLTNGSFGNCSFVHNFAGKYRQGFGTPFDLQDLDSIGNLDLNSITHIQLIDVVGVVDSTYGSVDCMGRLINDPWPTNFDSGGFDLDGIGVIHQGEMNVSKQTLTYTLFPNPTNNQLFITTSLPIDFQIIDTHGKVLYQTFQQSKITVNLEYLDAGIYYVQLTSGSNSIIEKICKL